jgi:hypothetical protein
VRREAATDRNDEEDIPMASKKKADRATAVPAETMVSRKEKIDGGHKQIAAILASKDIAQAPDVSAKAGEWSVVIDGWEANGKQIAALELKIETLRANEPVFARRWDTKKRATLGAVTDFADGSIDTVKGFGCGVLSHAPLPPAEVPQNLHDGHSKISGTALAAWDPTKSNHDFMVQYTTNLADPATFAAPVLSSKASFKLSGQAPGATIQFRVQALDPKLPGGKTDWTAWVPVIVG